MIADPGLFIHPRRRGFPLQNAAKQASVPPLRETGHVVLTAFLWSWLLSEKTMVRLGEK